MLTITLGLSLLASPAGTDVHRWAGLIDPPGDVPETLVVLSIDAQAQTATLEALGWGLPATELKHNTQFWTGSIGGQAIAVMGKGEPEGPFEIEMLKVGPVGPAKGMLAWTPPLKHVEGVRAFKGALDLPGMTLDMVIRLADVGGHLHAEMDIPLQSIDAVPMRVTETGEGHHILVLDVGAACVLDVEESESGLQGTFSQSGVEIDITFEPTDAAAGMRRPQLPRPPFPYAQHEIAVNHPEGHLLAGTLTVPQGAGPHPAAVLISGSGPQDRDETIMGHKPFLVLADHLTRHGIAVLRYDDRGVGESYPGTSKLSDDTSMDFASDVELLVDHLRSRSDIDPMRIGLIGHSEGGLIAPIVAARRQDAVHFAVLLAGPGVPGRAILLKQQEALLLGAGVDPEAVARVGEAQRLLLDAVMADSGEDVVRARAKSLMEAQMAMSPDTADVPVTDEAIEAATDMLSGAWMRAFLEFDPAEHLRLVRCPVLALNGTLDLQVPVDQNLPAIEQAIRSGGGDVTIVRLEGLNHLFQPAETGTLEEYPRIETTFDPAALELISNWINDRMEQVQ